MGTSTPSLDDLTSWMLTGPLFTSVAIGIRGQRRCTWVRDGIWEKAWPE